MRVRYSFSSRKTGRTDSSNKHRKEFPDITRAVLDSSDIILEVLDARFIEETRNPELEKTAIEKGKKIIFVLNKSDLTDEKEIKKTAPYPFVMVSCKSRRGSSDLREKIKIEAKKIKNDIHLAWKQAKNIPHSEECGFQGIQNEKISVGVIGYPNTGKSSIINLLTGKPAAGTAAESGFTKGIQKIKLSENLYLIDTPGVIPDKENSSINRNDLVKHGMINVRTYDKIREPEFVVHELMKRNPEAFEKFYNIKSGGNSEVFIDILGKRKGFLSKGGVVNIDRTARLILKDWQEGKIR